MPNHAGLPVHGYRPQTDDKISHGNRDKELDEVVYQVLAVLRRLDRIIGTEPGLDAQQRWLDIGRGHIEQGYFAIERAIFKPTDT